MAKNNFKFIMTTSSETARALRNAGFRQINTLDGQWVFLNEVKTMANFNELEDVTFTNKLMF